ncbi:tRNA1(Val) (adenine(37)-N6)-methyltransferase [Reichenbachiella sp.]|uniref:tRNA1(Val) (adenine(37)-N6)-methyltransferase n=1 Tax=Reichenbachiella sp. TaxID=2184521 RepID=UPI003BB18DD2
MANSYFQFKQFTIHQGQCAMKVSTEACILGAWIPVSTPNRILDIGTGTGLLSLMLAQRINAPIDAIELDEAAAQQAKKNALESKWKESVKVINQSVFEWTQSIDHTYDLIVSNPPFFTDSLKSETNSKNLAKHDTSEFNKQNLAAVLKILLSENGRAYILYPELESQQFKAEVEKIGLFYSEALVIRNQPKGPVFRVISKITKTEQKCESESLNIREGQVHSESFEKLLSGYYLKY